MLTFFIVTQNNPSSAEVMSPAFKLIRQEHFLRNYKAECVWSHELPGTVLNYRRKLHHIRKHSMGCTLSNTIALFTIASELLGFFSKVCPWKTRLLIFTLLLFVILKIVFLFCNFYDLNKIYGNNKFTLMLMGKCIFVYSLHCVYLMNLLINLQKAMQANCLPLDVK